MNEGNGLFSPAVGCILRLLCRINWFQAAAMGILTLIVGFGPAAYALAVAHIIGGLGSHPGAQTPAREAHAVFGGVLMLAAIFLLQQIAAPVLFTLATSLGSRLALLLRTEVMRATTDPSGLAHLEEPESANAIERAASLGSRTSEIINIVYTLPDWASSRLQGYSTWVHVGQWHRPLQRSVAENRFGPNSDANDASPARAGRAGGQS